MEIITVRTTQNIDIDYEIGGLGERILAYTIDYAIFIALALTINITLSSFGVPLSQLVILAIILLVSFYDLVCEVFFNGQSVGKLIMKIRVISLDGARPRFSQYLLRWLFRMVDFTATLWLGGLISAAMTKNGQRIGDIVAGTVLIKTSPRTTINKVVFAAIDENYIPVFTQAGQLSSQDVELIHEVIQVYFKTGNSVLVHNMAERVKQHFLITPLTGMNSMQFLQTIIKDYTHIAAHAETL